ncbi:hypothetical protein BGW80DRAFT_1444536 [Lactifluus volemus]|nr:hypothetical protein BGW80DRAFT_1444536 [Lactifluus volemus]
MELRLRVALTLGSPTACGPSVEPAHMTAQSLETITEQLRNLTRLKELAVGVANRVRQKIAAERAHAHDHVTPVLACSSISNRSSTRTSREPALAKFVTRYRAIVFKPLKGEVVDGVVYNVTLTGIFAEVGLRTASSRRSSSIRSVVEPIILHLTGPGTRVKTLYESLHIFLIRDLSLQ